MSIKGLKGFRMCIMHQIVIITVIITTIIIGATIGPIIGISPLTTDTLIKIIITDLIILNMTTIKLIFNGEVSSETVGNLMEKIQQVRFQMDNQHVPQVS